MSKGVQRRRQADGRTGGRHGIREEDLDKVKKRYEGEEE